MGPENLLQSIVRCFKYFCINRTGGGYAPREMLSDAVATMVFMPTKFERTSYQLAEKFNFSVHDVNTLTVSFLSIQIGM